MAVMRPKVGCSLQVNAIVQKKKVLALWEDVMGKLINELLLLTCMGTFIASATYAVTLLR